MKKSLLVLGKGDTPYADMGRKAFVNRALASGFDVCEADYHKIKKIRSFRGEKINVMFFFPYSFWNKHCEAPKDTQLYGTSRQAYEKFRVFFSNVRSQLEKTFCGQELVYAIPPQTAPIDRDKLETVNILRAKGVPTAEPINYSSLSGIIENVSPERGVFIKCRYGAQGKGITVLHHDKWVTNYKVENGRLANYGINDYWHFSDISAREDLLGQLISHDVIVERQILPPYAFQKKIFDLRAYVVGDSVPYVVLRLNGADKEISNFSQGAEVMPYSHCAHGENNLHLIELVSLQAARAMNLRFAGVDIMFDKNFENPKVIELQAFPGFSGFLGLPGFNLADCMAGKNGLFPEE